MENLLDSLENKYPKELVLRLKDEIKGNLINYVFGEDPLPIFSSDDKILIEAFAELCVSFIRNACKVAIGTFLENCAISERSIEAPTSPPSPTTSPVTLEASRASTATEAIATTSTSKKRRCPFDDVTNVPSKLKSATSTLASASSLSTAATAVATTASISVPIGVNTFNIDLSAFSTDLQQQQPQQLQQQQHVSPQYLQQAEVIVGERTVKLPNFTSAVDNALQISDNDECFKVLPQACIELAEDLIKQNVMMRNASDYRAIGVSIVARYDALNVVIRRLIDDGLLSHIPHPPKTPAEYVAKSLQCAVSKLRSKSKTPRKATQKQQQLS